MFYILEIINTHTQTEQNSSSIIKIQLRSKFYLQVSCFFNLIKNATKKVKSFMSSQKNKTKHKTSTFKKERRTASKKEKTKTQS